MATKTVAIDLNLFQEPEHLSEYDRRLHEIRTVREVRSALFHLAYESEEVSGPPTRRVQRNLDAR